MAAKSAAFMGFSIQISAIFNVQFPEVSQPLSETGQLPGSRRVTQDRPARSASRALCRNLQPEQECVSRQHYTESSSSRWRAQEAIAAIVFTVFAEELAGR